MAIIYPARWTRGRILTQALNKAGNPNIAALAREQLNRCLEDLYARWEWPFLYTSAAVTIGTDGTFALPSDFMKTEDDYSLKVLPGELTSNLWSLHEIDIQTFHDIDDGVTTTTLPRVWAVNASDQTGNVFPPPQEQLSCVLYYKFLPPDQETSDTNQTIIAAYNADVPIFPYGQYLADAMTLWAYEYDENSAAVPWRAIVRSTFEEIRNAAIPSKPVPRQIELDDDVFRRGTFEPEDWTGGWPTRRGWWS